MLIVLAIIALIVSFVVTNFSGIFGGAQDDVARNFVHNGLEAPLTAYRIHMGSYPTNEQGGLNALLTAPAERASRWNGPYIKQAPIDPWGNAYNYRFPGTKNPEGYDLWSSGPDGTTGTPDDIGNWQPVE